MTPGAVPRVYGNANDSCRLEKVSRKGVAQTVSLRVRRVPFPFS